MEIQTTQAVHVRKPTQSETLYPRKLNLKVRYQIMYCYVRRTVFEHNRSGLNSRRPPTVEKGMKISTTKHIRAILEKQLLNSCARRRFACISMPGKAQRYIN